MKKQLADGPKATEENETTEAAGMDLVRKHEFPRHVATIYALLLGVLTGIVNYYLELDFDPGWSLLGWLVASVVSVTLLHEGVHGLAAVLLGHRPIFGCKPPLVYVTFDHKIPRGHFIIIVLAPLVLLDGIFALMYATGHLKLFSNFCFAINTIGSIGDIWIFLRLLPHVRGTLVQDATTGIEVWRRATGPGVTGPGVTGPGVTGPGVTEETTRERTSSV